MTPPDPLPILYACVAKGPTVLAELAASGDGGDLRSLAARCLDAAPRFHRLYTHTAGGRTYAFLIDDLLVFFAIADGSLPRLEVLVFLRRLQDAFSSAPARRRAAGHGPLPPICLQDELLPVLHRLTSHDEKPPPPLPPPLLFASPPSDAPLNTGTPSSASDEGSRERQKKAKKGKKKWSHELENRMEISVEGNLDADADADLMGIGGRKSAQKLWRQHIWMILLFDLVVCSILFAIWLSVCRGFQCIAG